MALAVVVRVPVEWRRRGNRCATLLWGQPMMKRIPFADPSPDRDDHFGVPEPPESFTITRKAAFQWPPECAWPFMDRNSDSDT
jgi:hypothetical protein